MMTKKMTKAEQIITRRNNFIDALTAENAYHEPRQFDASNGNGGKAIELLVKDYWNSRSTIITIPTHADVRKTVNGMMAKFECKSGGGELFRIDENGKAIGQNCDYYIYAMKYEPHKDIGTYAYVASAETFITLLTEFKLIRYKRSSYMQKRYKAEENWYYDRITIQSPKGRESTFIKMLDCLPTLAEFTAEHIK